MAEQKFRPSSGLGLSGYHAVVCTPSDLTCALQNYSRVASRESRIQIHSSKLNSTRNRISANSNRELRIANEIFQLKIAEIHRKPTNKQLWPPLDAANPKYRASYVNIGGQTRPSICMLNFHISQRPKSRLLGPDVWFARLCCYPQSSVGSF